jgi:signal transduction histidine kinase
MPIPSPNLKEVDFTPTDFSLLVTKAQHPGRVFSRLQLLETSQGMAYEGFERSTDAHIRNLRAKSKQIQLSAYCDSGQFIIRADKERLQQIHDNLLQNALRFTVIFGEIKLSLFHQGNTALLKVLNNGPQISEEALEHIFKRFYRGEKSRDQASGGTGWN